jgi:hypothetical protein
MVTVSVKNPFKNLKIYGVLADYRDEIVFGINYVKIMGKDVPYAFVDDENLEDPLDVFGIMISGRSPEEAAKNYIEYIGEKYEAYYEDHGLVAK